MRGQFLLSSNKLPTEVNIYADKSSVVLAWLLLTGIDKKTFSLREVAKDIAVSIGLVQRIFRMLVLQGVLQSEGVRTAKRFTLKNPELLLENWLKEYSITKKCTMRTYRSGFEGREELLKALTKSNLEYKVILALHSAAESHGCKNTNLNTLELYVMDPSIQSKLEDSLQLEPQERGYDVLLIEPYYKALLTQENPSNNLPTSSPLLTFLDLYHYPLRGLEQAEFMVKCIPALNRIYKRGMR
jgi:DNA-binding transcriptional regulator YhcF (GntR family)